MTLSKSVRRFWFGLCALAGRRGYGYVIPSSAARYAADPRPYPPAADLFGACEARFADRLAIAETYAEALFAIAGEGAPPRWGQDWFPGLDAAMLYALIRDLQPARIVEVGSGHSTHFALKAVADGSLPTALTALDPEPRRPLPAHAALTWRAAPVQEAPHALWRALGPGDFLVVDSSHVLMPGSDVDFLFNHVLPSLPAGVLIHLHDIFLPDDYPADWRWRGYNEQLAVMPLLAGGGFEILFASHYVRTRMAAALEALKIRDLPRPAAARESSLWLRKAAG
jgi:hypothetical protein